MYGYLEIGIQTPMARGRSTIIKWIRTSRLSIKYSLSDGCRLSQLPADKIPRQPSDLQDFGFRVLGFRFRIEGEKGRGSGLTEREKRRV